MKIEAIDDDDERLDGGERLTRLKHKKRKRERGGHT